MNKKFALIFSLFLIAINTANGSTLYQSPSSSANLSSSSISHNFSQTALVPDNLNLLTPEESDLALPVIQPVTLLPEEGHSWGSSIGWFGENCNRIGRILAISCVALFAGNAIMKGKVDNGLTERQNLYPRHRLLAEGVNEEGVSIVQFGPGYLIGGHTTNSTLSSNAWNLFVNYYNESLDYQSGITFGTRGMGNNDFLASIGVFDDEVYACGKSSGIPGENDDKVTLHQLLVTPSPEGFRFTLNASRFFGGNFSNDITTCLVATNGSQPVVYLPMSIEVDSGGADINKVLMKVLPHEDFSVEFQVKLNETWNQTILGLFFYGDSLGTVGYVEGSSGVSTSFIDELDSDTGSLDDSTVAVSNHRSANHGIDEIFFANTTVVVGDIKQVNSSYVNIKVTLSPEGGTQTSYILGGGDGHQYGRVVRHLPDIGKLFIGGNTDGFGTTVDSIVAYFCDEFMLECVGAVVEKEGASWLKDATVTNVGEGIVYTGRRLSPDANFRVDKGILTFNDNTSSIEGDCVRPISVTLTEIVFPTKPGDGPVSYPPIRNASYTSFAVDYVETDELGRCRTFTPTLSPTKSPSQTPTKEKKKKGGKKTVAIVAISCVGGVGFFVLVGGIWYYLKRSKATSDMDGIHLDNQIARLRGIG